MYHFIKINILNTCPYKDWYMNICRSFMQNSPKVETIHRSSIKGGYQQNVLYPCDGILLCVHWKGTADRYMQHHE